MSVDAKMWCPNEVWINVQPPVPRELLVSVPVTAFLTNQGDGEVSLYSPTPCEVHYWEVVDENGNLIQAKQPEPCIDMVAIYKLTAGDTLRGDNNLPLNGKLFEEDKQYTIRYKFWGFDIEDRFTSRFAY